LTLPAALVTGGATGIGRSTVRELGKRGYRVAVNHLGQPDQAADVADEVGGMAFDTDVADRVAVSAMVAQIERELGPIGVAVCSAGFDQNLRLEETDDATWQRTLHVLLGGCVNVIGAVAPRMRARGGGSIVLVSSELALIGDHGHVAYVAAKAAVLGLTRSMAHELAPDGIRVNCICPGPTDTGLLTSRWRAPEYLASIPLGRLGRPDEVATAIAGLAEATWTTGQVVSPNGGVVIQ
jgi:2-hydroxycyclohexanecarboxyl-CoA dehydrogenase